MNYQFLKTISFPFTFHFIQESHTFLIFIFSYFPNTLFSFCFLRFFKNFLKSPLVFHRCKYWNFNISNLATNFVFLLLFLLHFLFLHLFFQFLSLFLLIFEYFRFKFKPHNRYNMAFNPFLHNPQIIFFSHNYYIPTSDNIQPFHLFQ